MNKFIVVLMVSGALAAAACATVGGLKDEPLTEGVYRPYDASFDEVVKAVPVAIDTVGLTFVEEYSVNDSTTVFLAEKGTSSWSYGAVVRIVVERVDQQKTIVRVISKRRMATGVASKGDYSQDVFAALVRLLEAETTDEGISLWQSKIERAS